MPNLDSENTQSPGGRQTQILLLAAEGATDKEISLRLGISVWTIRSYWDRLRQKHGAASRTQALFQHISSEIDALTNEVDLLSSESALFPAFRSLFDGVQELAWIAEPTGKIVYCNSWWSEFSGYPMSEIAGVGCRAVLHPDQRAASQLRWHLACVNSSAYSASALYRGAAGDYVAHRITVRPVVNHQGAIDFWVGNAHIEDQG